MLLKTARQWLNFRPVGTSHCPSIHPSIQRKDLEFRPKTVSGFPEDALAVDPLDEDSLAGRGTCYTVTRQHEPAIHDFERLLRFPKTVRRLPNKHLYFMLAENCRRLERWIDAFFWEKLEHEAAAGDEQYGMLYESMVDSAHGRQVVGNA